MSATSNKQTNPTAEGHRVQISLNQLNDDVATLVAENTAHLAKITDLQKEVNVYKRAYDDLDNKHKALENITAELERKNEDLETRLKGSRVVILIDGDGSIFRKELLYQGTKGGLSAARQLSDHLTQFLTSNYGSRQYKLWVYIFLNKGGLMQSLKQGGHPQCAKKLEQFMAGFNQAAERFSMIDVGWAKEAADAKIKTYLEDEVRTSQTFKIIFGGCHDNGYVNNLRSQITAGYRDKLVLLKTYTEMAMGISELGLPTMSVTELFMTEKLRITFTPDIGHSRSNSIPATPMIHRDSDTLSVTSEQAFSDMGLYSPQKALLDLPGPSGSNDKSFTLSACSPLQADNLNLEPLKPRQLDPKIPIHKNQPPPCNLFYLVGACRNGPRCKFGHDYELNKKSLADMKKAVKRSPCPSLNKGEPCKDGAACIYGHACPELSKCFYLKQGRCRFVGANMHADPPKA